MPIKTIFTGALLIGLSFVITTLSDATGTAPWLPAIFGGVLALLGIVGLPNSNARRHAIHLAAVVALAMVVLTLVRIITSGTSGWEAVRQIAMMVIGAGFLSTAIGSFRSARSATKAQAALTSTS